MGIVRTRMQVRESYYLSILKQSGVELSCVKGGVQGFQRKPLAGLFETTESRMLS